MHSTDNVDDGYLGSGIALLAAVKKYGKENFIREVLCFCKTAEEAFKNEAIFIKEYGTLVPNGYNLNSTGGISVPGMKLSNEHKKKLSEAHTGKKCSEETKKKLSESNRGLVPWNKGKTKETDKRMIKLSESRKGQVPSDETRVKLSEAAMGHVAWNRGLTKETNRIMMGISKALIGEKSYNYGRTGSNNPLSKPILQYTKDGVFIKEWGSEIMAEQGTGVGYRSISNCVCGKGKTGGGFIWKFKETENKKTT